MTKATGKRALQKRREDLLWGELRLTRVASHLMHTYEVVSRAGLKGWAVDLWDAAFIVRERLAAIHREMAELGQQV